MTKTEILTQSSPWFIILCLSIGAVYAYLLYSKKPIWSDLINKLLAVVRFLVVSFICFLLLSPLVKQVNNYLEKPILLFAVDNSSSLSEIHKDEVLKETLRQLGIEANELKEEMEIEFQTLANDNIDKIDSIQFDYQASNISSFLSGIEEKYENQNLAGVVFFTDGIYNQGISPDYQKYTFPIYPIAAGDTVPKKDYNLKTVLYNKIAYRGNKFPIVAEFTAEGFANQNVKINLLQNGKVLESKQANASQTGVNQVTFYASSAAPGLQHYTVTIDETPGEFTYKNNVGDAYVEVIDNKEKILLVASAPHPDIKAIKNTLETKENYEFQLFIPGITPAPTDSRFDVIIFHQIPGGPGNSLNLLNEYSQKSSNQLFIVANQTNLQQFNSAVQSVNIVQRGLQKDDVFPAFNKNFSRFTLEESKQEVLSKYSPLSVPFGDYNLAVNAEVLLFQKVGNVQTTKPIIVVSNQESKKTGVMIGEGLWQWRIQEYAANKNTVVFDELFTKLIQYLSSKEDKRRFRVNPVSNEITENEAVVFETEVYNNIYEKIYGQEIQLKITDESGKTSSYSYINSQNSSGYSLSGLVSGIYKYTASTNLDGKTETVSGQFIIRKTLLESINITANHRLLKELAESSAGRLFQMSEISSISDYFKGNEVPERIHSTEDMKELINLRWLFFLVLLLISTEWVVRKVNGSF